MVDKAKKRFYSAISDAFLGDISKRIEGNSGYTNLMNLKNSYFSNVMAEIDKQIDIQMKDYEKDELYNKLYTFFNSYLNETGTPFFYKTEIHKNLYEKIYKDTEDVSLFWKTQKLFYVKSEAMYSSMEFEIDNIIFIFDSSQIQHQINNEKKVLQFIMNEVVQDGEKIKIYFNVRYEDKNAANILIKYAGMGKKKELVEYIKHNIDDLKFDGVNVNFDKSRLDLSVYNNSKGEKVKQFDNLINYYLIKEIDNNIFNIVIGIPVKDTKGLENINYYLKKINIDIKLNVINKALTIYKKQNEIDYFIHKDAKTFLKEQFDVYLYNYIFNGKTDFWNSNRINEINKMKNIAYLIIDYISNFENELKQIWLKPKFSRNSNYVITLDKLERNKELLVEIINSQGFDLQLKEWIELYNQDDESGKKVWDEFKCVLNLKKEEVLINKDGRIELNNEVKKLPIDTKYFKNIENKILAEFNNIDDELDGELIKSDNFQALNTIKERYKEEIDLIYIDPPFNTGEDFEYKDGYQDSTWLTLMDNRINVAYDFLKPLGSMYLHLDKNAVHLGKLIMNNKFGKENFRNEICWKKVTSAKAQSNFYSDIVDKILFYTKSEKSYFNKTYIESKNDKTTYRHYEKETGRYYGDFDFTQNGQGDKKYFGEAHGYLEPPKGKHWIWGQDKITKGLEENRIIFTKNGLPRVKRYLDEKKGNVVGNLWDDPEVSPLSANDKQNISSFETQKPEGLLKRIIEASCPENGTVLDFFVGTGTTISVAHKLQRKWIGIEMGEHFDTITLPRLKRVLAGDNTGISNDIEWTGGGFFKYYELEQYEDVLKRATYSNNENVNIFYDSEKMLNAIDINDDNAYINFKNIYEDVDIAQSISNLIGKKISKITEKGAILEDGNNVVFDDIKWCHNKKLKELFWWGK